MDPLDQLYSQVMQVGLLVLDQAIEAGDLEWARMEVQHLHNIPSLLGEPRPERHAYFWNDERAEYIEWINTRGSEQARSRMRTYFEPLWREMEPLIAHRIEVLQAGGAEQAPTAQSTGTQPELERGFFQIRLTGRPQVTTKPTTDSN